MSSSNCSQLLEQEYIILLTLSDSSIYTSCDKSNSTNAIFPFSAAQWRTVREFYDTQIIIMIIMIIIIYTCIYIEK